MAAPRSSFSMSTYLGNLAFPGKMFVTLACIKNKTKNDNALCNIFLATMVRYKDALWFNPIPE